MNKIQISKSGSYRFVLDQPGQELEIVGRLEVKSGQRKDWLVEVIHKAVNTRSRTDIKGVVRGKGEAKVYGMIKVDKEAKGSEAFLDERMLLLSGQSKAEVVPDLEIETDEVKCSHAAAVTKIDQEQVFYLRSRGLTKKVAEEMIVEGFLQ